MSGASVEVNEMGAVRVVEIGLSGPPGSKGIPGTKWLHGNGAPAGNVGVLDDAYLDGTTGEVWVRGAAGWAKTGAKLIGPRGPQGIQGEQGVKGDTGDVTPELLAARDQAIAAAGSADQHAADSAAASAAAGDSAAQADTARKDAQAAAATSVDKATAAAGSATAAATSAGVAADAQAAAAQSAGMAGEKATMAASSADAAAADRASAEQAAEAAGVSATAANDARVAAEAARDRAEAAADGVVRSVSEKLPDAGGNVALAVADIAGAAPLDSPKFTGAPEVPTAAPGTANKLAANTAFVATTIATAIAALVEQAPATLDTLNEIAAALGDDPNFATTMLNALALKAPLDSPELTGNARAPTLAVSSVGKGIANTEHVLAAILAYASSRNRCINGNFDIWQRGTALPPVLATAYLADRWVGAAAGAALTAYKGGGPTYGSAGLALGGTAGNTYAWVRQRIESVFSAEFAQDGIAFSVDLYSSAPRQIALCTYYPGATDDFSTETATLAKTVNHPGGGTWVRFSMTAPAHANYSRGATVGVEFPGGVPQGQTVGIARAQAEPGAIVTAFERRLIELERALCKRYWNRLQYFKAWGYTAQDQAFGTTLTFPDMRRPPTVSFGGIVHGGTRTLTCEVAGFNSMTIYALANATGPVNYSCNITLDAEL